MELVDRYIAMQQERGAAYKPRTRHLDSAGRARFTNRLFLESSPYLLQHAHNPVDWYPWGDEAFAAAREKNRPVLLSVGYSTCHWCHVMEEESFEDLEVAAYINEHYIAVKVDREERPDVDAIYMNAVQAIAGRGGWPMTVWLTPDRKPFYGGTYFPARDGDRGASMGFLTLLRKIKQHYGANPDLIRKTGNQLVEVVHQMSVPDRGGQQPTEQVLDKAVAQFLAGFDRVYGGYGGAPKFPSTMPVRLLLRYRRRTGSGDALQAAVQTLRKMAAGGIYDQVGGGFHRYATDETWLVPHFEKMLYDNALLVMAYLEGYQVTGDETFRQVVAQTLEYIQREMTAPGSGFYTATDADSRTPQGENEEGYFFTWTPAELEEVLGSREAAVAARFFGITAGGNFEGRSIPHRKIPYTALAQEFGLSEGDLRTLIAEARAKLYAHRNQRQAPLRDEKIITAWNGLMIAAFARAGLVLDNPNYVESAKAAANFVLDKLYKDGRLYRSYKDGRAKHSAFLDDYAFLMAALLNLFEVDPNPYWFETTLDLDRTIAGRFEDKDKGGFFMTADDQEDLIAREKPGQDGALPSGNAVMVMNLLRLSHFTTKDRYRQRAVRALSAFSHSLETNPLAHGEMLLALDFLLDNPKQLVIVYSKTDPSAREAFMAPLRSSYLPHHVLVQVAKGRHADRLGELIPMVNGKSTRDGKPVAYVCENGVCRLPAVSPEEFAIQIGAATEKDRT